MRYLNSDKLDGLDSSAFSLAAGKVGSTEAVGGPADLDGDGDGDAYLAYASCPAGSKVTGGGFEVFTTAGALVNREDGNGWLVVTVADADPATLPEDVLAVAQCYNPRGAVAGSVQSFAVQDPAARLDDADRARVLRAAARR